MNEIATVAVSVGTVITSSIVGPVVVEYFKKKFEKKSSETDPLGESLEVNRQINAKLIEVRDNFHADRIWIIQFHNGGHFYPTGTSIQKFSMVYELPKEHYPSCRLYFQNIPVSLFSNPIDKLYNGNFLSIKTDEITFDHYGVTNYIPEAKVSKSLMFPLRTLDGVFVGIIGIDFQSDVLLGTNDLNKLLMEAAAVSGVLINYLKK